MKNKLLIERHRTPHFRSFIEITSRNKNYYVLKRIQTILKRENKQWIWLFKRLEIPTHTLKTYFSGRENISMKTIEEISRVLKPFIQCPRTLMNRELPILKLGSEFEFNIDFIIRKYGITQGEIARYTGIDRSCISMISRGKTKQVRPDRLVIIYKYIKSRGVPLRSPLDLIYFPSWGEGPDHFIKHKPRKNQVFKYHSSFRQNK